MWDTILDIADKFITPEGIATVLALVVGWIYRKKWINDKTKDLLDSAASIAADYVYKFYVKKIKKENGSLTEEQKKTAMNMALEKAEEVVGKPIDKALMEAKIEENVAKNK